MQFTEVINQKIKEMITRQDIKTNLNYWKSLGKLDPAFFDIYNPEELSETWECSSQEKVFEVLGHFDYIVYYSGKHLLLDNNLSVDELDLKMNNWLEEIKAI